jgi:N-dimethylarginine dimethylaminohydrolase
VTCVGLTERTNQRGADQLAEFLGMFGRPVVSVPVSTPFAKTVATYLGDGSCWPHQDSLNFAASK